MRGAPAGKDAPALIGPGTANNKGTQRIDRRDNATFSYGIPSPVIPGRPQGEPGIHQASGLL
ncbi:hypothetical protein TM239_61840 [Bradyrhizobium sp. TM239]|nr:hypothetical protein TM239_61840 [Bradyrhizobium sp. TM239]